MTSSTPAPIRVLAIGWAIRWFGLSAYAPFLLIYLNETLRVPYAIAGVLLAVPSVVGLLFPVFGGGLADRFGRRRLILTSFAVESAGIAFLAAGALEGSLFIVVGGLVVARAAGTLGSPAVSAYVTDFTDRSHRATGQALMRSALNAGFTGGTLAGGTALALLTFGELAIVTTAVTVVGVGLTASFVPPSPYDVKLTTGRANGFSTDRDRPTQRPLARTTATVLGASFLALRRDRAFLMVWAAGCAIWTLLLQIAFAVPAFAHSELRVSYAVVGGALALNAAIVTVGQVPLTRTVSGRSMALVGVLGIIAYVAAFAGFGLEGLFRAAAVPVLFGLVVLLTFGECAVFYPVSTLPMNLAPEAERGAYAGAMNMSAGVGAALAPFLAGLALGATASPLADWAILALPAAPALLLLLAVRRSISRSADEG